MKKSLKCLPIILLCLLIPSIAFAQETVQEYLDDLHSQGKERVMVEFRGEVDPALVGRYGGKVIRSFKTVNGLLCEIPEESIELLEEEDNVLEVVPDMIVKLQIGEERVRDPEELAMELRLKEEYLDEVREEYLSRMDECKRRYEQALSSYRRKSRPVIQIYLWLSKRYRTSSNERLKRIYRYIISRYIRILKSYYASYKEALTEYREGLEEAKTIYAEAQSKWREKVGEIVLHSYTGPVEIRWNNLEAGLNSKAAWDRYNLSGKGVSIAIIDEGVNYTLPDLKDNHLGGTDIIGGDDDPLTTDPNERHGTEVASLAVGKGVDKIIGVAYNAGFYAIRVADSSHLALLGDIISGIEWAAEREADIISMSLGIHDDVEGWDFWGPLYEDACDAAYRKGIVIVAGSGNDGFSYSTYPAAFRNVVSVGTYGENQVVHVSSNGGVDVVAPGESVYMIDSLNTLWLGFGTSFAAPHAAGLVALQLEYARKNNIEYNNGYHFEVVKHGAVDLHQSAVRQGKGKIYAAGTQGAFAQAMEIYAKLLAEHMPPQTGYGRDSESGYGAIPQARLTSSSEGKIQPHADPKIGSIDLMAFKWPLSYNFSYPGSFTWEGYPAYYIGSTSYHDTTLINVTDTIGNESETIHRLDVTSTYRYLDTDVRLPGDSQAYFDDIEPLTIDAGTSTLLQDEYFLPQELEIGLYKTVLDLNFRFSNIFRDIKITDNESSIWCPPNRLSSRRRR